MFYHDSRNRRRNELGSKNIEKETESYSKIENSTRCSTPHSSVSANINPPRLNRAEGEPAMNEEAFPRNQPYTRADMFHMRPHTRKSLDIVARDYIRSVPFSNLLFDSKERARRPIRKKRRQRRQGRSKLQTPNAPSNRLLSDFFPRRPSLPNLDQLLFFSRSASAKSCASISSTRESKV